MRKIIFSIFICFTFVFVICSCSQKIKSGEVVEKRFTPAHTDTRIITTFIYSGKSMIPISTPYIYRYSDSWEIKIRDYSEDEKEFLYATYSVTEEVYNKIQIGDEFVYSKEIENDSPKYTREKLDE